MRGRPDFEPPRFSGNFDHAWCETPAVSPIGGHKKREWMGIEPTTFSAVKMASSGEVTALLTALARDADLFALVERLVEIWPRLSASERTNLDEVISAQR